MSQTSINKAFSSRLIKEAAQGMGFVEGKVFGTEENPDQQLKLNEFLALYEQNKVGDQQHGWNDLTLKALSDLTRTMTMDALVGFFAELEKRLDEEDFSAFFETYGVNNARYQHVFLLCSLNIIFNPAFKKRLMKTLEISKEWWSE